MNDERLPPPVATDHPTLNAYFQILLLKRRLRRGWLRAGVASERCESVADHSFGTALLCLLFARDVDPSQAALMALVHDLGEAHAGDITPHDHIAKAEKQRREAESLEQILAGLDPAIAHTLRSLWQEYAAQTSATARFVKAMDSLEMAAQAVVYHRDGHSGMGEFVDSAKERLTGSDWQELVQHLQSIFP